ncbi:hypothetical protein M2650_02580 [Luteimonas sp. SX5]|uniref:Uncharacterized protein n=1 Tax=Luteimonas galliterrae TaxID=2940486 RepID=A0ABT0MF96_9GAMM|nr:hypothetical protein [Luteimonas galliterrae]
MASVFGEQAPLWDRDGIRFPTDDLAHAHLIFVIRKTAVNGAGHQIPLGKAPRIKLAALPCRNRSIGSFLIAQLLRHRIACSDHQR